MRAWTYVMSALLLATCAGACAVTLTFDDVPTGLFNLMQYTEMYGVGFDTGFQAEDHTNSTWGTPRSGNNVLIWDDPWSTGVYLAGMGFVKGTQPNHASSVGGYFSTEPGVVLQMTGYYMHPGIYPQATATIGASGESWNNVYVEIGSTQGIGAVSFIAVTAGALRGFCVDDMTINFVPEPSSLSVLALSLAGVGAWRLRQRRRVA